MTAVFLAPFYVLINIYIVIKIIKAFSYCNDIFRKNYIKIPFIVIYSYFALSPLISFFLPYHTTAKQIVGLTAAYWFGVVPYLLFVVVFGQLISVLLRRVIKVLPKDFFKRKKTSIVCVILSVAILGSVCGYGIYSARNIVLTDYDITINKPVNNTKALKVALIADTHLGYSIGLEHIEKTVDMINAQKPDIVCIAGDIYDNDYDAIQEPDKIAEKLSTLKSTYGTYACWGNHDVSEKILAGFTFDSDKPQKHDTRIEEFLKKANINLLCDESKLIDNKFYVVGRVDEEKPATENDVKKTPSELLNGLDKTKPVIVMYHEPDELSELSNAGTDLLLCGHTHDGQLFPGNIITKLKWGNSCGYLKTGDMHNIVTSGVGIWGPYMRVGTKAEVVMIDVNFSK